MQNERNDREERARLTYDFAAWEHRGTPAVVADAALRADELAGWQLRRESRNDAMHPPVRKYVFSRGDSADELVGIEIYRAVSLAQAHRFLLWLLGEFQSGVVKERRDTVVGDVTFGISEPTMLLFARANCVVHVYNAGPRTTSVIAVANAVDAKLLRIADEPPPSGGPAQPA